MGKKVIFFICLGKIHHEIKSIRVLEGKKMPHILKLTSKQFYINGCVSVPTSNLAFLKVHSNYYFLVYPSQKEGRLEN